MRPLCSARYLASRLGIPLSDLRVIARDAQEHYREFRHVDPVKNKVRILKVPDETLKAVQRRILRHVLLQFQLPDVLHGGVPGRSPRTNAVQHVSKPLVVNLDVRKFFPSVDHRRVAEMFSRDLGCGRDVTWLLTRLTTIDGQLPQGAPTSTMIANLLLAAPVDTQTEILCATNGVACTRFVDDISFSGARARELINGTARAISRIGLSTWRRPKLKIMPRHSRQEVTGLTVNRSSGPSVSRGKRDRIRAAIFEITTIRDDEEIARRVRSIQGRIAHVQQFNPGSAKRLLRQLDCVLHSDVSPR